MRREGEAMKTRSMVCRELVELVTEYLDDALPPDLRTAVSRHLGDCDGCLRYARQLLYLAGGPRRTGPAARRS
jgi:hypothetical protein